MKSILYATDCTPKNGMALRYAYRLSSAMKAQLHVLHVYEEPTFPMETVGRRHQLELSFAEEQLLVLREYCEKQLEHEYGPHQPELMVEENGSIAQAILQASKNIEADVVLVGIKDYQSLRSYFSEDVANRLLAKIEAPLLLLPPEIYYHGLSTLVYATDFEEADIYALKKLVAFAEPYGALIKVVHVPRKEETDYEDRMDDFEQRVRQSFFYPEMVFCTKLSEDVETGINACIQEELPEMLVMLEREHGYWHDRFFKKDMVEVIEGEISIPLLVFNKKGLRIKPVVETDDSFFMQWV